MEVDVECAGIGFITIEAARKKLHRNVLMNGKKERINKNDH